MGSKSEAIVLGPGSLGSVRSGCSQLFVERVDPGEGRLVSPRVGEAVELDHEGFVPFGRA